MNHQPNHTIESISDVSLKRVFCMNGFVDMIRDVARLLKAVVVAIFSRLPQIDPTSPIEMITTTTVESPDTSTMSSIRTGESVLDSNGTLKSDHVRRDDEDLVWYFSYGSNMNPEVFEKKRKIKCRDHRVCYVPGYVLTYSEGIVPYYEPAFCTCVKREEIPSEIHGRPRPDIHGVAFLITKTQYEHMLVTEGGWGYQGYRNHPFWNVGHYGEEEVECVEIEPIFDDDNDEQNKASKPTTTNKAQVGRSFKAFTLVGLLGTCNRNSFDCNASQRYYDLVNIGAESSGLPKFYREYLKDHHPAFSTKRPSLGVKLAKYLYIALNIPPMFFEGMGIRMSIRRNEKKNAKLESKALSKSTGDLSNESFRDIVRPPWLVMKICILYRVIFLGYILQTLLFKWLKIPDGFRNDPVAVHQDRKVLEKAKSQ